MKRYTRSSASQQKSPATTGLFCCFIPRFYCWQGASSFACFLLLISMLLFLTLQSMIKHLRLLASLSSLILLQACSEANSYSGSNYTAPAEKRPKTAEELRAELLAKEQNAPSEYLKTQGTYHRNFINQLVLEGNIANAATLANFKDPVLSVTWYSKTGTEVGAKEYPIYELVRARGTTHYKLKTDAPSYVATVALGVSGATSVE
jgi:hypothetical protein